MDRSKFVVRSNDAPPVDSDRLLEIGTYNAFLQHCPYFDTETETFDSSFDLFKSCFPRGFAWELLELFSGRLLYIDNNKLVAACRQL